MITACIKKKDSKSAQRLHFFAVPASMLSGVKTLYHDIITGAAKGNVVLKKTLVFAGRIW